MAMETAARASDLLLADQHGERGERSHTVRRANLVPLTGVTLLGLIVLLATVGPYLYGVDARAMKGRRFQPPSASFVLGTDYLGRDVLAGIISGARTSLAVGAAATAIVLAVGMLVGGLAGYYGGRVDSALMRVTEFFQVLPAFLFAMVLVAIFSPTLPTIVVAIGVTNWAGMARLVRVEFLALRHREFVTAARAIGASDWRLMTHAVLPSSLPPIVVNTALTVGVCILFEAGLSFLGLGDANTISWGYMIGSSRTYLREAWWAVTVPGLAIFVTVLGLSLVGDLLNDVLDPAGRQARRAS
jgi:peptide/nickel transport system permease protein